MGSLEKFSNNEPLERMSLLLDAQQIACYKALQEKAPNIAGIYIGALIVMRQEDNPDKLSQASHSIREMMEKLPEVLDVPITAMNEGLKDKVQAQQTNWQETVEKTNCYKGKQWEGEIDAKLQKFLKGLGEFFNWFTEHQPRRRAEVREVLRSLDNSRILLPVPLEEENVRIWLKIRDYFVLICHHRHSTTVEEFNQWLSALERFLLDRLLPRTFDDIETIDKIIAEGEGDV